VPLVGMQLAECTTTRCDRPLLITQTGTCTDVGCLPSPPKLPVTENRLECAENHCVYVHESFAQVEPGAYFKLIVQFPDRLATSQGFPNPVRRDQFVRSTDLQVTARDRTLTLAPLAKSQKPTRFELFGMGFGLTLISELAVAALLLWLFKIEKPVLLKLLVAIAFINLLTFPVVWFFFPALQPFQYRTERALGIGIFVVTIIHSLLLLRRSSVTLISLRNAFLLWLGTLPLAAIGIVIAALFYGYGEQVPAAIGLPSAITLPASEAFAFLWETCLIQRISDRKLSLLQAGLLSFLMNVASLSLGLLLLPQV